MDINRFSTLVKLICTTAYVMRFVNNLKARIKRNSDFETNEIVSVEEYDRALDVWIKSEQYIFRKKLNFQKLKSSLKLFVDNDKCLRLKGRFGSSCMEYNQKHPVILCGGESAFTILIIRDAHDRVLHHGVETTLSFIRMKYWILKGRKTVKEVVRKCIICKRYQGRVMSAPETADLPEFRVNGSRSFETVGVDFAGPLYLKNKDATSKVYVLLLTCSLTRAIHLELTPNLNQFSFIRAFIRFMARKCKPSIIIHDNAKTFKAREVKRFLLNNGIKQRFILPASPWWGGFYERLVRSVKLSLRKTLHKGLVNYEELETTLCNIEAVINSRPLNYVSEDDMEEPLTPYHLMFGRRMCNYPVAMKTINEDSSITLKRLNYLDTILNNYWRKFLTLYFNELRQMHLYKNENNEKRNLLLNDVVLIKDDGCIPRQKWKLGKVEKLIIGNDGNVRGAKLKVSSANKNISSCYRPVQKLIPFEISEEKDSSQDSELHEKEQTCKTRPTRKAAIDGQYVRQLREQYL